MINLIQYIPARRDGFFFTRACKHIEFIVLNELDVLGGRLAVGFT